jgi:hypothetical protein
LHIYSKTGSQKFNIKPILHKHQTQKYAILNITIKMPKIVDEEKTNIANQFRFASISYGIFIVLVGTVFNTIEPFKAC